MNNLCDKCGKKPAEVQITKIKNGKKQVQRLCRECAQKEGALSSSSPFSRSNMGSSGEGDLGSLFDAFFGSGGIDGQGGLGLPQRESVNVTENFSSELNEVVEKAVEIAQENNNLSIDTQHLLKSLTEDSVAKKVFKRLKKKPEEIAEKVGKQISKDTVTQKPDFSPRVKRVFKIAYQESYKLGHTYVGPEHLLMALAKEGEGIAAQTLKEFDLDYPKIKNAVIKVSGKGEKYGEGDRTMTPTLDEHSRDLTKEAREGKLDPVIGRVDEINATMEILSRRTKNNPVLVGEAGVGKTAIAEGLATRIVRGEVPAPLKNKRLVELDLSGVVAGTKYRGQFEERLKKVLKEIQENQEELIVFVDELHLVVGAGGSGESGGMDAANILKPALARGELHMIGATTLDEYRKHIEKDQALERRLQPVMVDEPNVEQTVQILRGLKDTYEAHHRVKLEDEALVAASEMSDQYITDRFLPDKAIDLIDQAAAKVRLNQVSDPDKLKKINKQIKEARKEKDQAVAAQKFEKADKLKKKIKKLKGKKKEINAGVKKDQASGQPKVTVEDIAQIVSRSTGIPVDKLAEEEREKLLELEKRIHERIIGQNEAVESISEAVRRGRAGLKDKNRPIGSFIFLGPTGVGKTELAKTLAQELFGDEEAMVRVDMSEYMEKHSVSRLIGAPPGYVGHEESGQLTEAVRRKPYSVVLLDEIEKAHPEVFNILLQILEDGRLTDGKGKVVDFKNTIIIATSNIGSQLIRKQSEKESKKDDKKQREEVYEETKEKLMEMLKEHLRPEFLNRLDEVIVFHSLDKDQIREIVELELNKTKRLLRAQGMKLDVTSKAKDKIAEEGYDPTFGARPLRRVVQSQIENPISSLILKEDVKKGQTIKVGIKKGEFDFEVE